MRKIEKERRKVRWYKMKSKIQKNKADKATEAMEYMKTAGIKAPAKKTTRGKKKTEEFKSY